MHAKLRNGVYLLYRTKYAKATFVDKQTGKDVKIGQTRQVYVMSIQKEATSLPAKSRKNKANFTDDELAYLEQKIFTPARVEAESRRLADAAHQRDPYWRIKEAVALLQAAAQVAGQCGIRLETERVEELSAAHSEIRALAGDLADPMEQMVESIRRAGIWISEGGYGKASKELVRSSKPSMLWAVACELFNGPKNKHSVMRVLQELGYVKKKDSGTANPGVNAKAPPTANNAK